MTFHSLTRVPHFLLWRLPLLAVTLTLLGSTSDSLRWAAVLALPLVTGMLAVYLFEPERAGLWASRGYLLAADAGMVSLALLGTTRVPVIVWPAFCAIVVVAALAADRVKTLIAAGALLGGIGSWYVLAAPGFEVGLGAVVYVPFLFCAAAAFGAVAEQLAGPPQAMARARQETSELWALLEMTDAVGSTLDVGQVMRSIVKLVGDLVDTESCSILLVDDKLRNCFVVASKGHPEVDRLELDLDNYPEIRRALVTREPVVIEDVESDPLVRTAREILLERGYRSLLVVPLLFGREVLGTLFLRARREKPFTPDEIRFCKVAAGTSANALKNALLYREVAEKSEKLVRVLDSSPDLIVATDDKGRVTEFNRGAERMTGWPAARARGCPFRELLGADLPHRFGEEADRDPVPRDVAFRNARGEEVQISLVSAPLTGARCETGGRVWIGRDVTKLRRVEKSLAQAERLSSLGEVVAGVAHELNNPLSSVMGYAQLMLGGTEDLDRLRDLERIVESAARCQKIVYKLLSFARQQPPEKRYQNLNDCVSRVLDLKAYQMRSSQITTRLELCPDLPPTRFDFHQIEQVILNLLNNAEQAISGLKTPGRVVLRTGTRDGFVFLEVEDDGPGVPAAIRDRIFDPFFTTKAVGQGTGLGLSVSFGIVEEHHGRLEYAPASAEGGARFTLLLPIVQGPEDGREAPVEAPRRAESALRGRRVLVAEDEPLVLELFNRVLSDDGARVTLARDGEEAWQRLEAEDYDLVVADLRMPNLDGQRLYERVAAERPELLRRFVFATGDLARPETLSFLQDLPNRILTKPLEVETVRRVLEGVVASRGK